MADAATLVDRFVRNKEAEFLLSLSATSRWRLVRNGELHPIEIMPGVPGFRLSEIQRFMDSRRAASPNSNRVAAAIKSPLHGRPGRRRSEKRADA